MRRGLRWLNILSDAKWFLNLSAYCGVMLIMFTIWQFGWWSVIILTFLLGTIGMFTAFPTFFFTATGSILISIIKHPIQSCTTVPENWRRIVLSTDTATTPEYFPGSNVGPLTIFEGWYHENCIQKWFRATAFFGLYPITAAYRWSVKATCLIYLPLIWLVETARFSPHSVHDALDDYQASDWRRFMLAVSAVTIAAVGVKWMLVLC